MGTLNLTLPSNNPPRCPQMSVVAAAADRRWSHYEVLRVKSNASHKEIKMAYRTLAKVYHPDATAVASSDDACRHFMEIQNSYATLSDPNARAVYDFELNHRFSVGLARIRNWETDQCW